MRKTDDVYIKFFFIINDRMWLYYDSNGNTISISLPFAVGIDQSIGKYPFEKKSVHVTV